MKLSRAGWNNVIIFSVMAFILIINATHENVFSEKEATTETGMISVVGHDNVILTMMVNQKVSIEREGASWRSLPEKVLARQAAEQMMRAWHNAEGSVLTTEFDRQAYQAVLVTMMIAGSNTIHMYSVYPLESQLIIFNHQTASLIELAPQMYRQLLPKEVL